MPSLGRRLLAAYLRLQLRMLAFHLLVFAKVIEAATFAGEIAAEWLGRVEDKIDALESGEAH